MAENGAKNMPLLSVRDLAMGFASAKGVLSAVAGISFDVAAGETYALLGESGCGKSATALALMRLLPAAGRVLGGEVYLDGRELLGLPETEMRALRGGGMAMIFQEPATSLNPVMTVGRQIGEVLARRGDLSDDARRAKAEKLLAAVGIADAARRLDEYPFQMSGGMKQRVMIAMALAGDPALLVADEPTTALDVSIQAQIIALLKHLAREKGAAVMLVTHDMGVIAETCDRVAVMYAGRIAELGPVHEVIHAPAHPYSRGLMGSIPAMDEDRERLLQIDGAMPRLNAIPRGCAFNPRCPQVFERCRVERPELMPAGRTQAACWLHAGAGEVPR